ncbi:MAG TPA: hypothetical protein VME43_22295 [Bryobacteraceae bacterium]|nr:hypothetical protein [Bryobacteraceae bacterium]
MKDARPSFAIKLLPSLADFAFLMPIVFLFGRMEGVKTLLSDCDTGWHIRTGEWIVANHWVPARDIFSYSKAGDPWFAWEWGSDVLMAWLNAVGGLRVVVLCALALISTIFALVFLVSKRKANPIVAVGVTMLAAAASSIHWLARPHLFTLFFLVLFYAALEQVREGHDRLFGVPYLAILPVVTVLWTNLHGGFFVGVVVIGVYGASEILRALVGPEAQRADAIRQARRFLVCAGAALAASLINPYFYHLHAHMLQYLRDPFNSEHIVEFLSPNFHGIQAIFFEAMLALGAAAACWNLARSRFTEPLLLLVLAHAALLAARNIPLFMIVAAPIVAAAIQECLDGLPAWNVAAWLRQVVARFNGVAAETATTEAIGRWHLVSLAGLAVVAALIYAPHPPKRFRAEFDPKSYPAGALALLRQDPAARIFTHDEWGDYLIWKLYPGHKVFVDGRSDFYGDDFEYKYLDVMNVKYGWEKTLGRFGVNTILLPPGTPLAGALKESSHWRVVYDDGIALVFRPAEPRVQQTLSAANLGGGISRDREITKTLTRDPAITAKPIKSKS